MNIKDLLKKKIIQKAICIILLLSMALISACVISKPATSPEKYMETIESIDEKKATVMSITATAAAASTALASIPGDATTPIANQIMEISTYLFIVVCVLVFEKSMLTVMGYLSFVVLIPIACILLAIHVIVEKGILKKLALKFIVFALVIVAIIPLSLKLSDLVYEVNISTIEELAESVDETLSEEVDGEQTWLEKMLNKVKDGVSNAEEKAKQILNRFIDAIAIFIIAYCAIPVVAILLVLWFVKFLFHINVSIPNKRNFTSILKAKEKQENEDIVFEVTKL